VRKGSVYDIERDVQVGGLDTAWYECFSKNTTPFLLKIVFDMFTNAVAILCLVLLSPPAHRISRLERREKVESR
jgi:hypothetical protein